MAMQPLREALLNLVSAQPGSPRTGAPLLASRRALVLRSAERLAASATLLAAVLACSLLVPNLEFVFALLGGTACLLLALILPCCIHLSLPAAACAAAQAQMPLPPRRATLAVSRCAAAAGLLALLLCTRATLTEVMTERQSVTLAVRLVTAERATAAQIASRTVQAAAMDVPVSGALVEPLEAGAETAAGGAAEEAESLLVGAHLSKAQSIDLDSTPEDVISPQPYANEGAASAPPAVLANDTAAAEAVREAAVNATQQAGVAKSLGHSGGVNTSDVLEKAALIARQLGAGEQLQAVLSAAGEAAKEAAEAEALEKEEQLGGGEAGSVRRAGGSVA
jgi:hypothetical protein